MKKIASFLLLLPLIAFQCSKGDIEPEADCGCNSLSVVKTLNGATATIRKMDPTSSAKYFLIYLDEVEANVDYSTTLTSCDSLAFNSNDFRDGSRIRITGEIKKKCSSTNPYANARLAVFSPIVIKKIEILSTGN